MQAQKPLSGAVQVQQKSMPPVSQTEILSIALLVQMILRASSRAQCTHANVPWVKPIPLFIRECRYSLTEVLQAFIGRLCDVLDQLFELDEL